MKIHQVNNLCEKCNYSRVRSWILELISLIFPPSFEYANFYESARFDSP